MSQETVITAESSRGCTWCGKCPLPGTLRCDSCGVLVPTGSYERGLLALVKEIGPGRLSEAELQVAHYLGVPSLRNYVRKGVVGTTGYMSHIWLPKRFAGRSFALVVFDPAPEPDEGVPRYDPDE